MLIDHVIPLLKKICNGFLLSNNNIFIELLLCAEYYRYKDKESKESVFVLLELREELTSWGSYTVLPSFSLLHPIHHGDLWILPASKVLLCTPRPSHPTSVTALDIFLNPKLRSSRVYGRLYQMSRECAECGGK